MNKVSEDVKDVLKKVKALAESKKAMKEELSRLQDGTLIFVSKWMMISLYTLPLKFSPKNQQRR